MMNRDELNHLEDEEWDRNRAKRERLAECARDAGYVSVSQYRREKALETHSEKF